jgi:hypothetical protein
MSFGHSILIPVFANLYVLPMHCPFGVSMALAASILVDNSPMIHVE